MKYNFLTSTGAFAAAARVGKALHQDDGLIRIIGFTPVREENR
jgi:hypothetical protein